LLKNICRLTTELFYIICPRINFSNKVKFYHSN
jgi:hypothetical protein